MTHYFLLRFFTLTADGHAQAGARTDIDQKLPLAEVQAYSSRHAELAVIYFYKYKPLALTYGRTSAHFKFHAWIGARVAQQKEEMMITRRACHSRHIAETARRRPMTDMSWRARLLESRRKY